MVKFIFFDIGDVLFDENAQHQWLFHTLLLTLRAHGKDVLWDDFNATRKALAAQGPNPEAAIKGTLAAYCVNESETETLWHEARDVYQQMRKPRPFGQLLDGITPVLQDLRPTSAWASSPTSTRPSRRPSRITASPACLT